MDSPRASNRRCCCCRVRLLPHKERERERKRKKRVSGVVDCVGPVLFSLETQKEGEKKEKKKKVRISHPSTHMDGEWNG